MKIKFTGTGNDENKGEVHLCGPITDYTICGYTLDGDTGTAGDYEPTKDKINCVQCLEIIKLCKKIRL